MTPITFNNRLFPWSGALEDFMKQNNFFNNDFFTMERSLPAINIKEHLDSFELELAAPGFEKKDFEISIKDHVLEVNAKKDAEEVQQEKEYVLREFNYRSFKRTLQLPEGVDVDKNIKATYENGILRLNLRKKEVAGGKEKKVISVN